ncbi:MAG: hypothetical protein A3H35_13440 [Betaproteobacteria bacterium RIFCSPLOWO2_02_FULL_62_17]|nr:MAG: hypothetical protein A3H35_13440 [Betaproteobacteria bacterium RIFCSPLOWO2_02_FULL_62_17]
MPDPLQPGGAPGGALAGVRVLDLSHGIAGPFAARLLGDFGADVIKIEKPGTGDFARFLEPLKKDAPAPEQSLLFQYLNWNKRSIALDLRTAEARPILKDLIEASDIVIESFRPGTLDGWSLGFDQMFEWNPRAVLTSVTNFGETGPYANYRASDLVLQAMSGIMQISGRVDREPLKHGLSQSCYCAGLNAAYASLMAYTAAVADGIGEHVDVSMHECLASELVLNEAYYAFLGAVQGRRAVVQDPFSGEPIAARKGFLALQTGGGAPFENYADLFEREEFRDPKYASPPQREQRAAEVRALLEECLADKDAKDMFLKGAQRRLLVGMVQGAADLLECEHLHARDFFVDVDHPVTGRYKFPGELVKLSATPMSVRRRAPLLDEHRAEVLAELTAQGATPVPAGSKGPQRNPGKPALPLAGVRVLDLSYVFAVPYMGGLLSDLGAEVIKIEAPHRLDQTRDRTFRSYLDNDPGEDPWNRTGIFQVLNRGKESLVLDMGQPQGREVFRQLVQKSDIVLENYTPRVMPKWGLHYEELKKLKPSLIMLSNTGYGSTGPWSAFPSQGTTMEATMGITHYTGYRGDKPWKVGQSYPDFLACWSGLGALFAALTHRRRTGEGQWIDLGMYQIGAALVAEPMLQKQLDGSERERIGNEHPEHVPSNLYRARGDDRWVAITVENDAQWAALAGLMNQPRLSDDERFRHAEGRRRHRSEIDALVAKWTCERDVLEILALLQSHGIACGPVFNARDLLVNEHLRQRGFYERVEHGAPIGARPIIGRPYRLRFRDARIHKQAPRFGEHNRHILRDLLGMNSEQIESLFEAGIVSDRPTNPGPSGTLNTEAMLRLHTLVAMDSDYRSRIGLSADDAAEDQAAAAGQAPD